MNNLVFNNPFKGPIRKACLLVALVLLIMFIATRLMAWGQCIWYGYETDRTIRYSPFIGCMIQTQNGWVPRNELRTIQ